VDNILKPNPIQLLVTSPLWHEILRLLPQTNSVTVLEPKTNCIGFVHAFTIGYFPMPLVIFILLAWAASIFYITGILPDLRLPIVWVDVSSPFISDFGLRTHSQHVPRGSYMYSPSRDTWSSGPMGTQFIPQPTCHQATDPSLALQTVRLTKPHIKAYEEACGSKPSSQGCM